MKKFICFCFTFVFSLLISNNLPAQTTTQEEVDDKMVQKILLSQNVDELEYLINQGLDVNSRDADGNTMLYFVLINNNDLLMARKLIEAGADVNLPSSDGITPILVATSKANELQLRKAMFNSMEIDVQKEIANAKLNEEIEYEMNRAIAMLQMLIENGADVNQETPLGTPLMSASTSDWNADMVDILLKSGAKINQQDKNGRTALFYAQIFNCNEILKMLLQAGADITIKDKNGKTYLEAENFTN